MSVTYKTYDPNSGVRRITITTGPQLHPFSAPANAANNYYCLGLDSKGLQYQIDLQAMPAGVTIDQIKPNQVWWVEKRTSLYRLYLYAGQYDAATKQIVSTAPIPVDPNTPFLTISGGTISGNLTVASGLTVSGSINAATHSIPLAALATGALPIGITTSNIWSASTGVSTAISGYNNYIVLAQAQVSLTTAGAYSIYINASASPSMSSPTVLGNFAQWVTVSGSHNYGLSTFASYSPGASTTFYMQIGSASTVPSANLLVIGLN